jgi:membrane associated rhomboid family serine protease/Flp pilus assembly protein TadD
MLPPPPLRLLRRRPVTVATGLLAAGVSVAYWAGFDVGPLVMDYRAWKGQLWRPFASALPHLDLVHLLFNLYWLWYFGARVERAFGPARAAGLYLALAGVSSAAQHALGPGGVGLSGVGYGLCAFAAVYGLRDRRFAELADRRVTALFVGWFALCVLTTWSGVWEVGNVAHAAGAALGALLGGAAAARGAAPRVGLAASAAALALAAVAGSSVGRPYVNLSAWAAPEFAAQAYEAHLAGHYAEAAALLKRAVAADAHQADWWYNLGLAQVEIGDDAGALGSLRNAHDLRPTSSLGATLSAVLAREGARAVIGGDAERALRLFREARLLGTLDAVGEYNLGLALYQAGNKESARVAFEEAARLNPRFAEARRALEWMDRQQGGDGEGEGGK